MTSVLRISIFPSLLIVLVFFFFFFFFNDTATTEIYTLSLHDALPISPVRLRHDEEDAAQRVVELLVVPVLVLAEALQEDRKSTRLNSSHLGISYAVFCLKKKKKTKKKSNNHKQKTYTAYAYINMTTTS